jgi:hypothetical protein
VQCPANLRCKHFSGGHHEDFVPLGRDAVAATSLAASRKRPAANSSNGQHRRRKFLRLAAGAAALPAVSRAAIAQSYPSRPITMIVPFAAGGSTDVVGRVLAQRMGRSLGQTIIIENVGGADGSIGTAAALPGQAPRRCQIAYKLEVIGRDTGRSAGLVLMRMRPV